jgi:hypothetical protein
VKRCISVVVCVWATTVLGYDVAPLLTNGPSSNRIDIVILGDGYTVAQQAQFLTDATRLKTALFNTSPWREYQALST